MLPTHDHGTDDFNIRQAGIYMVPDMAQLDRRSLQVVLRRLRPGEQCRFGHLSNISHHRVQAGLSGCALAKSGNDSAIDIYNRVEDFINKLYEEPLPVPNATIPGILTNGRARRKWLCSFAAKQ